MILYRSFFLFLLLSVFAYAKESAEPVSKNIFLSFEKAAKNIEKSIVIIETQSLLKTNGKKMLGSGVVIGNTGYIATSNSLLLGLHRVTVRVVGKKKGYIADVIGRDRKNDIAVLKIREDIFLKKADFVNPSGIKTGDIVFAVGGLADKTLSMTHGIVSYKRDPFIYSDVTLGYENFGGALVDHNGAMLGLNSSHFSSENPKKSVAVSCEQLKKTSDRLIEEHKIVNAHLGMILDDLESRYFGLYGSESGALVVYVEHNKSADNAGVKKGDLILGVDKEQIKDRSGFVSLLLSRKSDGNMTLDFIRDRFSKSAELKLSQINKNFLNDNIFSYKGITIENISKEIRERNNIAEYIKGVYVSEIEEGTLAKESGIAKGDVIVQIDNTEISDVKSFADSVGKREKERIFIFRNGWNFIKLLEGKK